MRPHSPSAGALLSRPAFPQPGLGRAPIAGGGAELMPKMHEVGLDEEEHLIMVGIAEDRGPFPKPLLLPMEEKAEPSQDEHSPRPHPLDPHQPPPLRPSGIPRKSTEDGRRKIDSGPRGKEEAATTARGGGEAAVVLPVGGMPKGVQVQTVPRAARAAQAPGGGTQGHPQGTTAGRGGGGSGGRR